MTIFPDQESARAYLSLRRWPNGVCCTVCGQSARVTARKGGYYRCNQCREDFTVRTGTIFERSHVPLHQWLVALSSLGEGPPNLSSIQLAKRIAVTVKTAGFMLQRLHEPFGNDHIGTPPESLDVLVDRVLAYCPRPKSKPAKKRARRAKTLVKSG